CRLRRRWWWTGRDSNPWGRLLRRRCPLAPATSPKRTRHRPQRAVPSYSSGPIAFCDAGGLIFGNLRIDKAGRLCPRAENFHQLRKAGIGFDFVVERAAANAKNSARLLDSNKPFFLHLVLVTAGRTSVRRD